MLRNDRKYISIDGCKISMKNCFKTAFLLEIKTSMDQIDVH